MKEWIKKHYWKGIIMILLAFVFYISSQKESTVIPFDIHTEETIEPTTSYIYVDLKGEVQYPGVYKVEEETRLFQVVSQAGGFTSEADKEAINLSKKVIDQQVIYVPNINEEYPLVTIVEEQEEQGIININTASLSTLQTLNGIGPSTAQAIIDYRDENGLFQTIEEIMNVPGIGETTFDNIKDFITI